MTHVELTTYEDNLPVVVRINDISSFYQTKYRTDIILLGGTIISVRQSFDTIRATVENHGASIKKLI